MAAAAASATLAELSGNRFELGLGVSNRGLNETRGHEWTAPAPRLTKYLGDVQSARIGLPENNYPISVAAHGPKMLAAASEAGANAIFTYLMNPEHTARTKGDLPDEVGVSPMMMCLLCEEPEEARRLARKAIEYYTGLDYYHRAWRTLGFDEEDFTNGGSDALVDSIVAWGSMDDIRTRLAQQQRAGARRVVVIPLNPAGGGQPEWKLLEGLTD